MTKNTLENEYIIIFEKLGLSLIRMVLLQEYQPLMGLKELDIINDLNETLNPSTGNEVNLVANWSLEAEFLQIFD